MTILVVDDDAQIRRLVRSILSRQGFQTLEAHDAQMALGMVRQHGADVAALVTDIHMPRMSGVELAQALRTELRNVPVLFLSTLATPTDELARAVPGCRFVQKPFRQAALVEAVRKLVGSNA
jgi:CheY-like chemotaxis protein